MGGITKVIAMKYNLTFRLVALLLAVLLWPLAQAQERVMKNADVTEDALIDALAVPQAEPAASEEVRTRGFRPATRQPDAPQRPAGPGKANLLITFRTDSSELTNESQSALDILARAMQSDKLAGSIFRVEGHADARGDVERNLRLSQLRAESVVSYLVNHQGILQERLMAQGKGSSEPLNKTRIDAPENRRVTIVTLRN